MRIPTADECSQHEQVALGDGRTGTACWYPQMGGYWGKAVAVISNDCVDVYVWHDGEFPFGEDDSREPALIHHCDGEQFIAFGKFLVALQNGEDVRREPTPRLELSIDGKWVDVTGDTRNRDWEAELKAKLDTLPPGSMTVNLQDGEWKP